MPDDAKSQQPPFSIPNKAGAKLPWEPSGTPKPFKRAGFVIDLRRCVGCHACSVSCKTEHDVPLGLFRTRVRYVEPPKTQQLKFMPMLCMHCVDAPCIPACPTESVKRHANGTVFIEPSTCEGNTPCIEACPYDAISFNAETGLADKCDACHHRTEVGMDPACVASCPTGTLQFGDLDNPEDSVMQYAETHNARAFRAEKETKPSVLYVGLQRSVEETVQGGIQLNDSEDEVIYVQK